MIRGTTMSHVSMAGSMTDRQTKEHRLLAYRILAYYYSILIV